MELQAYKNERFCLDFTPLDTYYLGYGGFILGINQREKIGLQFGHNTKK